MPHRPIGAARRSKIAAGFSAHRLDKVSGSCEDIHMTNNNHRLIITSDALALVEALLRSLIEANRLDGYFARQVGGAWGAIDEAMVTTLACAIADRSIEGNHIFFGDARDIARRLRDEAIDNGENISYQIRLWNEGIISL